jgi:hypothetical protein
VYKFPQQCVDEGAPKKSYDVFQRTIGKAKPVLYHITNKAPDPKSHDWRRVVAVFVSGQAWQFKGWPHPVRRSRPAAACIYLTVF